MYNPDLTCSINPGKLKPGAVYRFGIVHYIDGRTDTMQVYEFDNGYHIGLNCNDGNQHGED